MLLIRGTGLLILYSLQYLGLHNKPKVDVHPGHKLTGPEEEEGRDKGGGGEGEREGKGEEGEGEEEEEEGLCYLRSSLFLEG